MKSLSASGSSASWEIGLVYGGLGDLDQAWVWYERLVESRDEDPRAWKYSPLYADLVKDPRYAALQLDSKTAGPSTMVLHESLATWWVVGFGSSLG